MKVYTATAVARFLNLTDRRIRQLKDEGIIKEYSPGLYDLREVTLAYIDYKSKGTGGNIDLIQEKAKLIKAKREAEEIELRHRKNELIEAVDVERIVSAMLINFKSRLMSLPSKLAPVVSVETDKTKNFKYIKNATDEALKELSDFNTLFETLEMLEEGETENDEN